VLEYYFQLYGITMSNNFLTRKKHKSEGGKREKYPPA
jgi:hypothetical protein